METNHQPIDTDIFIVGGGPAGLAAGIAARRKGFRVVIADCARPPIDKACGEGLMPDALAALNRLGVAMPDEIGHPFNGIHFLSERSQALARFAQGLGLGIRRTRLHETLVESAIRVGVSLLWGAHVSWTSVDGLYVNGEPVRCRWIVGADGQKSRVREWAGIPVHPGSVRFGFRGHFNVRPWTDYVEVHWGRVGQLFVTPVNPSEVCIALVTQDSQLRFDTALPHFSKLDRSVMSAAHSTTLRGALSVQRRLPYIVKGNFILIGDASGSIDAISGEGLCLSFRQAECLADALSQNDLELYQQSHRQIQRVPSMMARLMLLMDRYPLLQHLTLRSFEGCPGIFRSLLARHLDHQNLTPTLDTVRPSLKPSRISRY